MISLIPVSPSGFDGVFIKMCDAFPYEERRDRADELACFEYNKFKMLEIDDNGEKVGFVSLWDFEDFVFIDHIAVDSDRRSGGYGTQCIELIKNEYSKPIILEAEKPVTVQQKRRIAFYERLGFKINPNEYYQPSFHGTDEKLPLMVLSFPSLLTKNQFDSFYKSTRKEVYKIADFD